MAVSLWLRYFDRSAEARFIPGPAAFAARAGSLAGLLICPSRSMPHAVARLREERLARSLKPFVARGSRAPRCTRCRVPHSHCLCAWLPRASSQCGVCLLMHDIEPLKPSNTGWLIADVVADNIFDILLTTRPRVLADAFVARAGHPGARVKGRVQPKT